MLCCFLTFSGDVLEFSIVASGLLAFFSSLLVLSQVFSCVPECLSSVPSFAEVSHDFERPRSPAGLLWAGFGFPWVPSVSL